MKPSSIPEMKSLFIACPEQAQIRSLIDRGQWPHASPPELAAHAAACQSCSDLALLSQAFLAARSTALPIASLPPAGLVWWRAQLRMRNEAVARMNKPILGAQIFAVVMTMLTAAGLVASQATHGLRWLDWFARTSPTSPAQPHPATAIYNSIASSIIGTIDSLTSAPAINPALLISALATLALLSGVVLYLATEKQ